MYIPPFGFDFKNPDYVEVLRQRIERLNRIRKKPAILPSLKSYYRDNPAQFISDWGCTFDPRNTAIKEGVKKPATIPFILFPRQVEWVEWVLTCWRDGERGLTDKSRDVGMSWLSSCLAATLCIFNQGVIINFGSRKEMYVDRKGDLKALLPKARFFIESLPPEFRAGCDISKNAPILKIYFPETGSYIGGESGEHLGRGDRVSIYFIDEAPFIEHAESLEASLSQTTNCRIDIGTPRGRANPFGRRRFDGSVRVFSFHWRDDPRKNQEWYATQCRIINDPVIIASELDLDYDASVEGVLIPAAWVNAAIDAHIKLGIQPAGARRIGLDVADEGRDNNGVCGMHGVVIDYIDQWSGKGGNIYDTVEKTFLICDLFGYPSIIYDADGLGAGVRGDAEQLNKKRAAPIEILPYRGSAKVTDPEEEMVSGRTNLDFFSNYNAQSWWYLRMKFLNTYRAIVEGLEYDPDEIISISSSVNDLEKLKVELSQPTYSQNDAGKLLINKTPEGALSPNLADAVKIANAPRSIRRSFFDV